MHTITELESMQVEELVTLASQLGLDASKVEDKSTLIYQIIDEESIQGSRTAAEPAKKKRGRKPKAEAEATASEQETPSEETAAPKKRGRKPKAQAEEQEAVPATTEETAVAVEEEKPAPKKRGRKPKAQAEAEAAEASAPEVEADNTVDNADAEETVQEEDIEKQQEQAENEDKENDPVEAFFNSDEPDFIILKDVDGTCPASFAASVNAIEPEPAPIQEREHEQDYDFDNTLVSQGVLEISQEGYGYLRSSDYNYLPAPDDIFISAQQIRQYGLKTGDVVEGPVAIPREGERYYTISRVNLINGRKPVEVRDRIAFEHLTPLFPDEKFTLCNGNNDSISSRVVDLFAPIGKGQRALLVAQPKTGKTLLMKDIANSIAANHPEAYLMVLLIDERPEEVTDMARTVNAEVIASTFDEPAEHHVHVANLVLEKAKRLVECGHDVVIFLDSITRLARAYNTVAPASGKILSGGVDANSLQKPKRFFGAARNIEGGGSLTIIATALIDTGSKMDEVIFEEFKGTGNMELQLDRQLSNKRIFPAVNIIASSTRRDDLLQDRMTLDRMWILRKLVADMTPVEAMTFVKDRLEGTKDNVEFLMSMGGK